MMKTNKLREILNNNQPSIATRILSAWPTITEAVASTGKFDYIEFVAEYAPFSHADLENICRAAELHNISTMIKVDFQNRAYVAQKAMASGFQALLLTDHKTPEEVRETMYVIRPDTPEDGGRFGYPNRRWIGYQPNLSQMDYAAIPGVDMVQFGPSDYSMSLGWNAGAHVDEYKAAEREMIRIALKHGVQPRCEINSADEAKYYIDLGVRHFCIGDELRNNMTYWNNVGGALKEIVDTL